MTDAPAPPKAEAFLETQEYRRFAEFCDACRHYRYIGLCHGPAGVGKTLSARHYARWEQLEPVLRAQRRLLVVPDAPQVAACRALVYTPAVTTTPRQLTAEVQELSWDLKLAVARATDPDEDDILRGSTRCRSGSSC